LDRIGGRIGHGAIFLGGIEAAYDSIQIKKKSASASAGFKDSIKRLNEFRPAFFGWAHALVALPLI